MRRRYRPVCAPEVAPASGPSTRSSRSEDGVGATSGSGIHRAHGHTAFQIAIPDDDHPNPVGDTVVTGVRKMLNRLGPVGEKAAEHLPDDKE
jgi:hypothetical protein